MRTDLEAAGIAVGRKHLEAAEIAAVRKDSEAAAFVAGMHSGVAVVDRDFGVDQKDLEVVVVAAGHTGLLAVGHTGLLAAGHMDLLAAGRMDLPAAGHTDFLAADYMGHLWSVVAASVRKLVVAEHTVVDSSQALKEGNLAAHIAVDKHLPSYLASDFAAAGWMPVE